MILQLLPLLGTFPAATNLEAPPAPALQAEPAIVQGQPRGIFTIDIFHEFKKFDDLEYDDLPDAPIDSFTRRRTGVKLGFGPQEVSGYVRLYGETADVSYDGFLDDEISAFGIGGGVCGIGHAGRVIVDYSAGLNVVGGKFYVDGDEDQDADLAYVEFEGHLAVGGDIKGWMPKGGLYLSSLSGTAAISDLGFGDDLDFSAANFGLFAEVGYNRPDKLVSGSLRVFMIGDVQGLALSLGFRP